MKNIVLYSNPHGELGPESSIPVKNNAVAERIADIVGGRIRDIDEVCENKYIMPVEAVAESFARQHGVTSSDDIYGGIVRDLQHADKAVLHDTVTTSAQRPDWHSSSFAQAVTGAVLPGFTVFSSEDAQHAFDVLQADGLTARFKDPTGSCERGQYLVRTQDELAEVAARYGNGFATVGAVMEADLKDATTVTIGYVEMNGQQYSWLGNPQDTTHNGAKRFGGNELTVVRGGVAALGDYCADSRQRKAVEQTEKVIKAYTLLGSTIARATFDTVQGEGDNGLFLSGVTDPSIRPSASSPAEIRAIEAFAEYPDANVITTSVTYDYAKLGSSAFEGNQELFASNNRMNIFVGVISVA